MKIKLCIMLACGPLVAQAPAFIPIAESEQANYRVIIAQRQLLEQALETIRWKSCAAAGLNEQQCGQWDHQRGVILRVTDKPKDPSQ